MADETSMESKDSSMTLKQNSGSDNGKMGGGVLLGVITAGVVAVAVGGAVYGATQAGKTTMITNQLARQGALQERIISTTDETRMGLGALATGITGAFGNLMNQATGNLGTTMLGQKEETFIAQNWGVRNYHRDYPHNRHRHHGVVNGSNITDTQSTAIDNSVI